MKKFKVLSALSFIFLAIALSSCLGESKTEITQNPQLASNRNMSVIIDRNSADDGAYQIIGTGADYSLSIELTERVFNLSVSGLQLKPGAGSYSFTIANQTFTLDKFGGVMMNIPSYVDEKNNVRITDFKFHYLARGLGGMNIPVWTITYTVNDQYDVRVVPTSCYYFGSTQITDLAEDKTEASGTETYYCVQFDPKTLDGNKVTAFLNVFDLKIPGKQYAESYVIEKELKATVTPVGYTISGVNCKLMTLNNKETDFKVNSCNAVGTFIVPTGEKIPDCLDINFVIDNKYRFTAATSYGFVEDEKK